MAAVQLDVGQKAVVDAIDTAMDQLFSGGAEQPPGTPVITPLLGYDKAASIENQDLRPAIRQAFIVAFAGLMTGVPAWTAPTLAGSWVNYGGPYNPPGFYKDALGFVRLRGLVALGSGTIFTLPPGYRPEHDHIFLAPGYIAPTRQNCHVYALTTGVVYVEFPASTMDWVSLDAICFRAA